MVADDTGLEVEALGGAPGVRSARYAGENATYDDNLKKLLADLSQKSASRTGHTSRTNRSAAFITCAVALFEDGTILEAEGKITGEITPKPRGSGGFGYDAVFAPHIPGDLEPRTYAEMSQKEKNLMSHRFIAVQSLVKQLAKQLAKKLGKATG